MDIPETDKILLRNIKLVRRDIGNLLFHFTRTPDEDLSAQLNPTDRNALTVLRKILEEGKLLGSSNWITNKSKCICFTEAPIHEFAALFSLVKIAADKKQRPRYEPYGIAVRKDWLYKNGGRPVIYDNKEFYDSLPEASRYRHVLFDPQNGIDCTWEREWRICCDDLILEPEHTLVIVPDAKTAFEISYSYSEEEVSTQSEIGSEAEKAMGKEEQGQVKTLTRRPKWMAVSLDLFNIKSDE